MALSFNDKETFIEAILMLRHRAERSKTFSAY